MTLIPAFCFLVLGLVIGSFLNVVIVRFNTQKTFGGRSACMSCQMKLHWYDLIPVFSFFGLRGRCRTCKTKISLTYPLVELLAALAFFALFIKFQDLFYFSIIDFAIVYAYYATIFSLLLVIAIYDLKHKIIPDIFSLFLGVITFAGLFFFSQNFFLPHSPNLMDILSGLVVALPFALIWLLSSGTWMGLGDAKLALGLGWFLGVSQLLSAVMVAFWTGAIVGLFLIVFSKDHGMKSEVPFAPFLVLGAMLAFLLELNIIPIF